MMLTWGAYLTLLMDSCGARACAVRPHAGTGSRRQYHQAAQHGPHAARQRHGRGGGQHQAVAEIVEQQWRTAQHEAVTGEQESAQPQLVEVITVLQGHLTTRAGEDDEIITRQPRRKALGVGPARAAKRNDAIPVTDTRRPRNIGAESVRHGARGIRIDVFKRQTDFVSTEDDVAAHRHRNAHRGIRHPVDFPMSRQRIERSLQALTTRHCRRMKPTGPGTGSGERPNAASHTEATPM